MKTRNVAISVIVLAYSMFGVVGFISAMVSPTPIVKVISSGLTVFSYASIAILSKRMSFKELFNVLIPLNLINIVKAYTDLGIMYVKYQGIYGDIFQKVSDYTYFNIDASIANKTVTLDLVNQTLGTDTAKWVQYTNSTGGILGNLPKIPYLGEAWGVLSGFPSWVYWGPAIIFVLYALLDSLISILSNLFTCITFPIVSIMGVFLVGYFRLNLMYVYLVPGLWLPVAATVDSFLRIYLFRALFFRFMKKHPLIAAYSEGGYL